MPLRQTSKRILSGESRSIEAAVRPNGSNPALDYYNSLSRQEQAKFWTLFKRMAREGKIFNTEKFKKVENDIFEFKAKPHRILCFWAKGRKLILTHGFSKQSQRIKRADLNLANTIREEYLHAIQERGE